MTSQDSALKVDANLLAIGASLIVVIDAKPSVTQTACTESSRVRSHVSVSTVRAITAAGKQHVVMIVASVRLD